MQTDRPEMTGSVPELAALVERIHRDLRRERRVRRWRAGAATRNKVMIGLLTFLAMLALSLSLVAA